MTIIKQLLVTGGRENAFIGMNKSLTGRLILHSPESGARPGLTACGDSAIKSGTYLTQKGPEELTKECIDPEAIC